MATIVRFIASIAAGTAIGFMATMLIASFLISVLCWDGPGPMKDPSFALPLFGFSIISGAVAGTYSYRLISDSIARMPTQDDRSVNPQAPDRP